MPFVTKMALIICNPSKEIFLIDSSKVSLKPFQDLLHFERTTGLEWRNIIAV